MPYATDGAPSDPAAIDSGRHLRSVRQLSPLIHDFDWLPVVRMLQTTKHDRSAPTVTGAYMDGQCCGCTLRGAGSARDANFALCWPGQPFLPDAVVTYCRSQPLRLVVFDRNAHDPDQGFPELGNRPIIRPIAHASRLSHHRAPRSYALVRHQTRSPPGGGGRPGRFGLSGPCPTLRCMPDAYLMVFPSSWALDPGDGPVRRDRSGGARRAAGWRAAISASRDTTWPLAP